MKKKKKKSKSTVEPEDDDDDDSKREKQAKKMKRKRQQLKRQNTRDIGTDPGLLELAEEIPRLKMYLNSSRVNRDDKKQFVFNNNNEGSSQRDLKETMTVSSGGPNQLSLQIKSPVDLLAIPESGEHTKKEASGYKD